MELPNLEIVKDAGKGLKGLVGLAGAAARLTESVAPVAKALSVVAEHAPLIGGVVAAGIGVIQASEAAAKGNWKRAGVELGTGAAEGAVNFFGGGMFGLGDATRETIRASTIALGGENIAPQKSALRTLAENGVDLVHHFSRADSQKPAAPAPKKKPEPQQAAPKDHGPLIC